MRAVVQRVTSASVTCREAGTTRQAGAIGHGLMILLGVRTDDTEREARWLAEKIATLRIFEDDAGRLNRSLLEIGGAALVVSNFTLYGDCRKGRRPGFADAAPGEVARGLYQRFGAILAEQGVPVQYGVFGGEMQVSLTNDGPVTLVIESSATESA